MQYKVIAATEGQNISRCAAELRYQEVNRPHQQTAGGPAMLGIVTGEVVEWLTRTQN